MKKIIVVGIAVLMLFVSCKGEKGAVEVTGDVKTDAYAVAESFSSAFKGLLDDLQKADSADAVAAAFDKSGREFSAVAKVMQQLVDTYGEDELEKIGDDPEFEKLFDFETLFETEMMGVFMEVIMTYGEDPKVLGALERWQQVFEDMDFGM